MQPTPKIVLSRSRVKKWEPTRRTVDLYSWWQHVDRDQPICIVEKVTRGLGIDFRTTHIKTLRIGESDPSTLSIEVFWHMVDTGLVVNVTRPTEVTVVES
ncbi:hypothetical protein GCM10027578_21860 [Spirosoma luteolum]